MTDCQIDCPVFPLGWLAHSPELRQMAVLLPERLFVIPAGLTGCSFGAA